MVSRGSGNRRVPTADIVRELETRLARDPDISIRGLGRELRADGIRISNDRLRALTRATRSGVTSAAGLAGLDSGQFRSERQLAIAIRELGEEITERATPRPTHIALTYTGTAHVVVNFYGQLLFRETLIVEGRIVQPVTAYNPELIAERVATQIAGQVTQRVGSGSDTYIEGIEIEIVRQDIEVTSVDLRGDQTVAAARR